MSPESRNKQKKGRHGTAHDYFGLGVMIFVMFTCQYPFSKFGNFNTVIAAHLSEISVGGGGTKERNRTELGIITRSALSLTQICKTLTLHRR